jgi:glycosyltransferase involved in cell wall biosynthesis
MADPPVLFISHDAGRTGAPFVFLHLLRWIKQNARLPILVALKSGGPLASEFKELGPTFEVSPEPTRLDVLAGRASRRVLPQGWLKRNKERQTNRKILDWAREHGARLVYSNTTENGSLLEALDPLKVPTVSHLHELEFWIRNHTGPVAMSRLLRHTQHFVAGSQAVRDNLIRNHGVPENRIDIIRECIPVAEWTKVVDASSGVREETRKSLGIGPSDVVIGGAGTCDWRKAPDLFIVLAHTLATLRPDLPMKFVWVGGTNCGLEYQRLMHDVALSGLEKKVQFLSARAEYLSVIAAFDLFALISREDSFPLVLLEAALAQVPILCFDGAGGGREFVESDAGVVVPYLDVLAMAKETLTLVESTDRRRRAGAIARARVVEKHDVAVQGPRMIEEIQKLLGSVRES